MSLQTIASEPWTVLKPRWLLNWIINYRSSSRAVVHMLYKGYARHPSGVDGLRLKDKKSINEYAETIIMDRTTTQIFSNSFYC